MRACPEALTTICPASVSHRKLPVNFDQDHLQLFQHEFEKDIPKSELLKFENVRVSSEGLIFKDSRILPESFAYAFELDDWKRRSILKFLVTNYFFRRPRKIQANVLWITDYWSKGYFHWLTDALTRLYVVRDRLDQLELVLPWEFATRDFVRTSLEVFGVQKFDFIRRDEVLLCSILLMPTHTAPSGHFRDEVIQGVRKILLTAFGDSTYKGQGERIYISRRAAQKRRIVNEDELTPVLNKFGFQTVYAEELTFQDQVRVLSRARYLVSNHGAGLTNMLFMKDGGRVLELRHVSDYVNNCYFVLASALKFAYYYQLCMPRPDKADPHTADLIVGPQELEKNLALLLEN
ncbi:MAG TPA: glycosyltransferase family 61 protein [Pyrinomonadaceae bacterium]|nr:glycosyltransferase family 61 protein [Pyrinomonadaceae bacterium]